MYFWKPLPLLVLGGGEMISDVYLDHSTYAEPPSRFVYLFLFDSCITYHNKWSMLAWIEITSLIPSAVYPKLAEQH